MRAFESSLLEPEFTELENKTNRIFFSLYLFKKRSKLNNVEAFPHCCFLGSRHSLVSHDEAASGSSGSSTGP